MSGVGSSPSPGEPSPCPAVPSPCPAVPLGALLLVLSKASPGEQGWCQGTELQAGVG